MFPGILEIRTPGNRWLMLRFRSKGVLAGSTNGTDPVFGDIGESGPGSDVVVRVAFSRVIDIAANGADILFHRVFSPYM
jgi:hypothetical protein